MLLTRNGYFSLMVFLALGKGSSGQILDLRLHTTGENILRCTFTNDTDHAIELTSPWLENSNNLQVQYLDDDIRWPISLGYFLEPPTLDYRLSIAPNASITKYLTVEESEEFFAFDRYKKICWRLEQLHSNAATMTCDYQENGRKPCPRKGFTTAEFVLMLHRHTKNRNDTDIGFLVLNGSNTAVTVAQPLFNDSRLIVHAPKIGYSNEVFSVDAAATNATVAARGTTEWRVPWTNLWNRIPAADRTSLSNAHEVDLYWRTGGFTSDALPLWIE